MVTQLWFDGITADMVARKPYKFVRRGRMATVSNLADAIVQARGAMAPDVLRVFVWRSGRSGCLVVPPRGARIKIALTQGADYDLWKRDLIAIDMIPVKDLPR